MNIFKSKKKLLEANRQLVALLREAREDVRYLRRLKMDTEIKNKDLEKLATKLLVEQLRGLK